MRLLVSFFAVHYKNALIKFKRLSLLEISLYVEFQPIINVGVVNFSEKIVVDFSIQNDIHIISRPTTYIVILSSSR